MRRSRLPDTIVLVLVYGFLYLPIAVLVLLSFNKAGLPTTWSGFSTKWYSSLFDNNDILRAAWNTLVVAICATLISTVLGTMLAIGMETRRRKSSGLEALAFAPMVIPDIVLAVALLSFFSKLNLTLGLPTIIASHVIFDLAFVCSVLRARLKNFDYSIVEASRDLGASAPGRPFGGGRFPSFCPRSLLVRCWHSRCLSTNSSSHSSHQAPAAPRSRCRSRSIP
jgi:spermidine/putrescine transport system permease protein